ncbi:hypothetical protein AGMMS50225_15970 [Betaproteobacteria bacterium]|nr:hypothetical protein AGMMS50225_15970 [Betaproteobacteria bacterium]
MKQMTMIAALSLALGSVALPLQAAAAEGGSIASKVEQLGEMTYLTFTDMRAVHRDGLLRVQVTLFNTSASNEQLFYRFRWLDADGFSVWEEEPWKPETIYGKQSKVLNVTSPTLKAVDFRIEVQSPSNSTSGHQHPASSADNPPYR